jgi:hypothetical protein
MKRKPTAIFCILTFAVGVSAWQCVGITSVINGGTGQSSLPANCVLIGEGTSPVNGACPVHTGYLLTDNGPGSDPSFQPMGNIAAPGSDTNILINSGGLLGASGDSIDSQGQLLIPGSRTGQGMHFTGPVPSGIVWDQAANVGVWSLLSGVQTRTGPTVSSFTDCSGNVSFFACPLGGTRTLNGGGSYTLNGSATGDNGMLLYFTSPATLNFDISSGSDNGGIYAVKNFSSGAVPLSTSGVTASIDGNSTPGVTLAPGMSAFFYKTTETFGSVDWKMMGPFGAPYKLYDTNATAGTSSLSAATMFTPARTGRYRFSYYLSQTVLGASCAGNTTIQVAVKYRDPIAAAAQVVNLGLYTIVNNGTLGVVPWTSGPTEWTFVSQAAAIQYQTTYTAGGACSPAPTVQLTPMLESF